MAIPVGAFFEQSAWANERLLEVCAGLTDEQLDQHGAASYGSIRGTLLHLLSSEQSYLSQAGRGDAGGPGVPRAVSGLRRTEARGA